MAKYADYVKKQDQVSQELDQVQQNRPARDIPQSVMSRFSGKSVEDVLEAYANLERLNSRQGEDLGKLRKTVDQLIELQSKPVTAPVTAEPVKDVTVDDLYDNPNEAIGTVVEQRTKQQSDRIANLEKQLAQRQFQDNLSVLDKRYPTWREDIQKQDFVDWVKSSPARSRMAVAANNGDLDAGSDLLELWADKSGNAQRTQQRQQREQDFRNATLESSSPTGIELQDVPSFSRQEIIEKRIAAKAGNRAAERWIQANNAAITQAYAEGRITD